MKRQWVNISTRITLVFALLIMAQLAAAKQSAAPVILVIGDSLSAAYGMDARQGWVSLLATRLQERGYSYGVVNASVTGDTTSGGLARLPNALAQHQPELAIIELGGNDGLRGIHPREMRTNLEKMIALARTADARVLLIGIKLPSNYGPTFTQQFEGVFDQVAEAHKVPLVPFLLEGIAERSDLMQADGIHPSAQAQAMMLDNVWPMLKALLVRSTHHREVR